VANLKETPWIPGQHLFGVMIPRPEHETESMNQQMKTLNQKLQDFKTRVATANMSKGDAKNGRLALTKLGFDSLVPLSFGYEIVPDSHECDNKAKSFNETLARPSRISIILTSDEMDAAGSQVRDEVVLETDGVSVYEVRSSEESSEGEEGLEVVGLGRYSTFSDDFDEQKLCTRSTDALFQECGSHLSMIYKSSERIDVAFYHPAIEEMSMEAADDLD